MHLSIVDMLVHTGTFVPTSVAGLSLTIWDDYVPTFVPTWKPISAGQRPNQPQILTCWTAYLYRKTLTIVRFMRAVGTAAGEPPASRTLGGSE